MPSVGAGGAISVGGWDQALADLTGRIGGCFARPETRTRLPAVLGALVGDLPRKNAWTLGEHLGDLTPDGVQHLLGRAVWDTDAVAGHLRSFVIDHLGEPDGILIVDETGDCKKGTHTVGVQRQYSGTAGRVENCQVAVHLAYASGRGHALVDRELYLPTSWTQDRERCAAAGVPAEVGFATKPALAAVMIDRALAAGVPARWVAGDEVYGGDPKLARHLEARRVGYVLGIASSRRLPVNALVSRTASRIAADLPSRSWQTRSAGPGAHGHRYYEWAYVHLHPSISAPARRRRGQDQPEQPQQSPGCWHLLIRRHRRTKVMAYYLTYTPTPVPLSALIAVAGRRWAIEESFQASKGLAGLDEHQVRTWTSWRRWSLLAMAAHALLAVATALERRHRPTPDGLIALTCAEIRRLVTAAARTTADAGTTLAWSRWRRRHQHRARASHYTRQAATTTIK